MPLPPGFVLEQPQVDLTQQVRLPPGFVLEGQPQSQIQDLNPTEHLDAPQTLGRQVRRLPVVGELVNRLLGPEMAQPVLIGNRPEGFLNQLIAGFSGPLQSSPAALMREPQSEPEAIVKNLVSQVNPSNILLGKGLLNLHEADPTPLVNWLKASIASYFAKQGAEIGGQAVGERTAGLSQPRIQPGQGLLPDLSFKSNPAATPSGPKAGELDVNTLMGTLMALGPLLGMRGEAPKQTDVGLPSSNLTLQDMEQIEGRTPVERRLSQFAQPRPAPVNVLGVRPGQVPIKGLEQYPQAGEGRVATAGPIVEKRPAQEVPQIIGQQQVPARIIEYPTGQGPVVEGQPVRTKQVEGGQLPTSGVEFSGQEGTPGFAKSAEQRVTARLSPPEPTVVRPEGEVSSTPLETVQDKFRRALELRDFKQAVGSLVGQPFKQQRAIIDQVLNVGRDKVPLTAGERTIFNQEWERALQKSKESPLKPTDEQLKKKSQEGAINLQGPLDVLKEFKAKVMDGTQILNRLRNKLHPDEWKIYDDAGIVAAFANKKVDPKDVATWMQDNGPRVEVRKFGTDEGFASEADRKVVRDFGNIEHQLDTVGIKSNGLQFGDVEGVHSRFKFTDRNGNPFYLDYKEPNDVRGKFTGSAYDNLHQNEKTLLNHWAELHEPYSRASERKGESAAHWSSIAPKAEKDMPGYTEGAVVIPQQFVKGQGPFEGKGNAVEIDDVSKKEQIKKTYSSAKITEQGGKLYVEPANPNAQVDDIIDQFGGRRVIGTSQEQFPSTHSFPPNTLAFWRGYMETLPNGKKVFHVIEVQSDWAQEVREVEKTRGNIGDHDFQSHPLLRQYERLALKSAIEHAKAEGADAIAVSDAETAMMTEGHDLAHARIGLSSEYPEPDQAPGMRLHYDRTLPGVLEELTGQKGERVGFGEHKMALGETQTKPGRYKISEVKGLPEDARKYLYRESVDYIEVFDNNNYRLYDSSGGRISDQALYNLGGSERMILSRLPQETPHREGLIFKEPTGEPKTTVTAKMFPLEKVASTDFTAFGKDRPQVSEAAKFKAPSGKGLQLKPTEEQQRLRSQEGGGFGYRTYRKDIERTGYRPASAPSTQKASKSERAKAILSNPTAKPLETRPEYRAQPGEKTSLLTAFVNRITAAQNTAGKADKLLLPIDVIVDDLDGGQATYKGTLMQQVRWPLDDDFNDELQRRDKYVDSVASLVKGGKLNKQNGERIGVYAIAQQEGGIQRLIDSGVSQGTINKILGSMTPTELKVYREMRKQMDATLPEVQKLAKELYGTDVKPVKNYFPFKRDWEIFQPEADEIAGPKVGKESTPDIVAWRELAQDYGERSTKAEQGFTKERKPNAKTGIKVNAFEIYDRHMRDVAHFLAMQKNLKEVGEIVRGDEFKKKYGDRGQQLMVDWLNTVAKQGRYKRNTVLDTIRKNIAKGIIAFRIPSQLVHLANVPLAQERAGLVWHNRGLEASISDEGQAFLHKYFGETFERGGGEEALQEASRGPITRAGFYIQRELDRLNAQATVLGVYMKRLQEKGLDPQQFDTLPVDKDAVREARVLARRAVASPLYKDVPLALTKGGSGAKFFFQFQNTFLDQWSNIRYDLIQAGLGKNFVNNPKLAARLTLAVGMMLLVETGIKYGAKQAINKATGRKTKEDDTFSAELLHEATRRVPGMGQALAAIQYGETGVPGADVALEAAKATKQAIKAESSKERTLAATKAVTAVGELAGVPGVSQISDIAQAKMKSEFFKTHQQRLEEVGGKPLNKMTLDERKNAEVEVKKERGPQSRSDSAKGAATAIKNNEKRGEELQKLLDPKVQQWLDEKKLRIPGYTDSIPYQKQEIVLTKGEQARYKEILTEKYNKFLLPWTNTTPTKQSFSNRLEQAHNQAKTQLLNEIRSNSIPESDEKAKKKRFSFMGGE